MDFGGGNVGEDLMIAVEFDVSTGKIGGKGGCSCPASTGGSLYQSRRAW